MTAPIPAAAESLYFRLGEHSEDVLDEACAETWPGGEDAWWEQQMPPDDAETHREGVFRQVLAVLADFCARRAGGEKPWEGA